MEDDGSLLADSNPQLRVRDMVRNVIHAIKSPWLAARKRSEPGTQLTPSGYDTVARSVPDETGNE